MHTHRTRGFTLLDVVGLMATVVIIGAAALVCRNATGANGQTSTLQSLTKARDTARQVKCAAQTRGVVQGMIVWASNNDSDFPVPSRHDGSNATVADAGRAKDTTANIYSVLVYHGMVAPEGLICPDEKNRKIRAKADFAYTAPPRAVKPNDALWDPSFSVDWTKGDGHASYAHLQPSGEKIINTPEAPKPGTKPDAAAATEPSVKFTGRRGRWTDTFAATDAVFGDRYPKIDAVKVKDVGAGASDYEPVLASADSNALRIHSRTPGAWAGNTGYADGHVAFVQGLGPSGDAKYTLKDGTNRLDVHGFDEPDDRDAANLYLGVFTKAGATAAEYTAIWD